jgi:hypothetical protein
VAVTWISPSPALLLFFILLLVICPGCVIHKQSTYRLVPRSGNQILVPPGAANADVAQRTFNVKIAAAHGVCPPAITTHRKRIRVTLTREFLSQQPIGWLTEWTADLESQGCIVPGAGPSLAQEIAEALPLELNRASQLLFSSQLDITPQMRIQVVSPILREGAAPDSPILESAETSGRGNSLTVGIKSSANLLGYETAMYDVQQRAGGRGLSIQPIYADRHIGAETEHRPEPAVNYFQFSADAAFYRVFYEAQQTEYAAIIVAAPTRAELERRTKVLAAGMASCEKLNNELCLAVPKQVAINGLVPVTVNGSQTWVTWGTNIGGVVRQAQERPANLSAKLAVYKLHNGKPAKVEFDRANPAIFNLTVSGGEVISWK